MKIIWHSQAWDDYLYWQKTDKSKLKRINELIKSTTRTPFEGIGNPEPLKHELQGYWSRRIDSEHRLVYTIKEEDLIIITCKYHY
ncbi:MULTISPECIES: Txe/YoeB family addiction module toxin [Flavobacterium]|uniref:Toxin YoeB n=1 Tax=Flavobacterium gawalongense TaxID=2594432 RepID=A0A553BBH5_9FLAO|nr:Txe/YoeB family addiction module toxin [Flavobacterium gawalongense]TRW98016.1 Txe/YoeB family addiction module toxin [Flavobacterium gawalongense]TRX02515.1 Txe/YoeB family addiction module toxin [Flavobacterium gawalongense]TRX05602.1 Txe/YoeB family addiction module toxin [Flavobacterium gawalongense]TRX06485.1 Txe/YoeB family addiction module toxin [Flavobacterium gawalongense]TRX25027.1 Txe/YoeB family addiction module toxin [Flavobacterium gawalongense]